MFEITKKMFIVLLSNIVNGSNHTKCVPLSNQKCLTQPTPTNLHPNKYSQEFHNYPFVVKLDRCVRSCNDLHYLSDKVCVLNKTKDLILRAYNLITGINESKTLTKHMSCQCECRSDGIKFNSDQWWDNNKYWSECVKHHVCEKVYIWNHSTFSCENRKYLASIMDNSAIICNEVTELQDKETKFIPKNFIEKKAFSKISIIYLHFY